MPKIKSAKKALRQNIRHRKVNDARKKNLKQTVKSFRKLVEEKKGTEAKEALVKVFSTVDRVAKTKFIKKAKANRIKSRAAKLLKKLEEK
ncbi:MAG: 30S ribosomal protein S20 [Patescibacteria group bacterium]|nr:30S ribosomal protein S20 [Patescibacteria group bacterium]